MEFTGRDAWDRMGLWEFASHIRTITGIGTTARLVAPTVLTKQGVSDPMVVRSSAGHTRDNNPAAREQVLRLGSAGGRRDDVGFGRYRGNQITSYPCSR
jgi:hypothetical protein